MHLAKPSRRARFSAKAKSILDPVRIWPALFPVMEMTDPIPIIKAPPTPMNSRAESARGVLEPAKFGNVPIATN
jgi:hypothetical protein